MRFCRLFSSSFTLRSTPMDDLHEAEFSWPHSDASNVILTGSFDHWSRSVHLPKCASGFADKVQVPWDEKILYKFIVDGKWATRNDCPTEFDGAGNLNNILFTPSKPTPTNPAVPQGHTNSMPSVTEFPQVSFYSEKSQQQASEPDLVVSSKQFSPVTVGAAQITEPLSNHDDPTFNTCEEIASAAEYISFTPNISSDSSPAHHVLNATEQPSATEVLSTVAEVPTPDSVKGGPSPKIAGPTLQIAPRFPIAILPVNDHTLNESAGHSRHGVVSHPAVAALSVLELSTHSPMNLSKAASPSSQRTQRREMLNSEPTKEENLEMRVVQENAVLSTDAIARPLGVAANITTPGIDVLPNPFETTDTTVAGAETPKHERSSLAPELYDTPARGIMRLNDNTKHSRDVSFPSSVSTDSPSTPPSTSGNAITRKKRRSFFTKVKDFLSNKDKKQLKK